MAGNREALDGVTVFVQVVESGSFTAAAKRLGNSTSFISKEVTRLENRLDVRLLNRTTRKISLTDVGRLYFERCKQLIADAEEAERSIHQLHGEPRGVLKVSAPVSFGLAYLRSALPQFLDTYPDIQLEIELNDRFVDVVAEGFDVVIRVGDLADSNLISRQIMPSHGVIVASPDYLKKRGRPRHPSELARHDCISYAYKHTPNDWEFTGPGNETVRAKINARVVCNSAELEEAFALAGTGITRLPSFVCERSIADGLLEEILEDYARSSLGVYAIYPHRQHLSAKVRALVDFLVERFSTPSPDQAR